MDTLGAPLAQFATLIFVIDIRVSSLDVLNLELRLIGQDLYNQPISKLVEFIVPAYHQNPNMNMEIFVHKAEKLQEDDKYGLFGPWFLFPYQSRP